MIWQFFWRRTLIPRDFLNRILDIKHYISKLTCCLIYHFRLFLRIRSPLSNALYFLRLKLFALPWIFWKYLIFLSGIPSVVIYNIYKMLKRNRRKWAIHDIKNLPPPLFYSKYSHIFFVLCIASFVLPFSVNQYFGIFYRSTVILEGIFFVLFGFCLLNQG